MELVLLGSIDPTDTVVTFVDNGAISEIPTSGTLFFVEGDDWFEYTGVSGNTCTGVSGLAFYHESGETLTEDYGFKFRTALADIEGWEEFDPDNFTEILLRVLDSGLRESKQAIKRLRSLNNPVFCHPGTLYDAIRGIGVDAWESTSEDEQRMLGMSAGDLIKHRGSAESFRFLAYLMLGYQIDTKLLNYMVPMCLGDSYGTLYGPPRELEIEPFTTGLWRIDAAPLVSIPNEVSTGQPLIISNGGMWVTTPDCGLFEKDSIIQFTTTSDTAFIQGSKYSNCWLHGRTAFAFELMFRGDSGGTYPQNIAEKVGVFSLSRHSEKGITLTVTSGSGTETIVADDVLSLDQMDYIAFSFGFDEYTLVVNESTIDNVRKETGVITDVGNNINFGSATTALRGSIDMVRMTIGVKHPTEFLSYYEHIRVLRTAGTHDDETTYFKNPASMDGCIDISINNYDGNNDKLKILNYLAEEWLEAGGIRIHPVVNWPCGIASMLCGAL